MRGIKPGHLVYIASTGTGFLKIGCSADPAHRMTMLGYDYKYREHRPFTLIKTVGSSDPAALEAHLHFVLDEYFVYGELFDVSLDHPIIQEVLGAESMEAVKPPINLRQQRTRSLAHMARFQGLLRKAKRSTRKYGKEEILHEIQVRILKSFLRTCRLKPDKPGRKPKPRSGGGQR